MGCGPSTKEVPGSPTRNTEMPKSETALKAAMLIQKWYRRYMAHLELRRQFYWKIFESIEFSSEQEQLKLYNFFNEMLIQLQNSKQGDTSSLSAALSFPLRNTPSCSDLSTEAEGAESLLEEDQELQQLTDPDSVSISSSYRGPHIKFPLTSNQLESLMQAFKKRQVLHAKYLLQLLHKARKILKKLPNISRTATSKTKQITICGDLHGKFDDLLIIFYKNGLPSSSNPYLFNGDFVDRGPQSVEITCILFMCLILYPNDVILNRGNHEDHVMNLRYGFIKEIMGKYKDHANKLLRLFEDVFSWLPLATVIDKKVLVAHGGISDKTDLDCLSEIDRHQYRSALKPPQQEDGEPVNYKEWRQILDLLWSDPKTKEGCRPNEFRGGGCYFGPDVTQNFLNKNKLSLIIRSHECKPEGYEFTHSGKVLTIFSASNYYEIGSNKGAYVKLHTDLRPQTFQFMATRGHLGLSNAQRVGVAEEAAYYSLKEKIYAHKSVLLTEFSKHDKSNTGLVAVGDWCEIMSKVLRLDLPWHSLRPKLVQTAKSDQSMVVYNSVFENFKVHNKYGQTPADMTEMLYRNKESLETIFRAIDKDNSGKISMDEFRDACALLSRHSQYNIPPDEVQALANAIDINKDGFIDFNEFLEAFRIVDQQGREVKSNGVIS